MEHRIVSVSRSATHSFLKTVEPEIRLLTGLGVEGDAHAGATVQHRYHIRKNPGAPNLCQIHLLQAELFAELLEQGIHVTSGAMGENVTTLGLDLLGLARGTRLYLGADAVVEVTGLRSPCVLMNGLHPGLMKACLGRDADGGVIRKAGVMAIVLAGGVVRAGDDLRVEAPPLPWVPLAPL